MLILVLISFAYALQPSQATAATQPKPADVLQGALKAVEKIESVEYEVRSEITTPAGDKIKVRTTIFAARTPFQFSAKLQGEVNPVRQIAVSDGTITRASYDGKVNETSTFAARYPKEKLMPILNDANRDVSATWRLLLDADFLKEAIASGNIMYVKQEDLDGDLCNVVLYVRNSEVFESMSEYYWFSAETGLPRAVQRLTLTRGRTNLSPRFTISKVKPNAIIPAGAFSYRPTSSDSSAAPMSPPKAAAAAQPTEAALVGSQLPALEARDMEFKPVQLSDFGGKPSLITFWAPWCAPCMAEFPVLQKMQDGYKGELQIVAVAVQDSRLNVLKFIKENPRYKFIFLTDPEMQESESRLGKYFGLNGIPVNVFVDARGKIVEHWSGFKEGEQALVVRVQRLMGRRFLK